MFYGHSLREYSALEHRDTIENHTGLMENGTAYTLVDRSQLSSVSESYTKRFQPTIHGVIKPDE